MFLKDASISRIEFLEPTIETEAIVRLSNYLRNRFEQRGWSKEAKAEVITCFDVSGSGKTTTIREAAAKAQTSRIVISHSIYPTLRYALQKCDSIRESLIEDVVECQQIEARMKSIFSDFLVDLFDDIVEMFISQTDYAVFWNAKIAIRQSKQSGRTVLESFQSLQTALKGRNLIIHVDDCQGFGWGLMPGGRRLSVPAKEIMSLALRSFSDTIACYAAGTNICWAFTGTLPNLRNEIRFITTIECFDVSRWIPQFTTENILTVLGHYYNLPTPPGQQLLDCAARLCGPPKNTLLFLRSCLFSRPSNCKELTERWEDIENDAIEEFSQQIMSGLQGDLDAAARSICSLYITCYLTSSEEVQCETFPVHLSQLVDCGLLRIRAATKERGWHILKPSRLLVNLLGRYVSWFTWANVGALTSAFNTAASVKTVNNKIFEFLFALEICGPPDSRLWQFLGKNANIKALDNISYSIDRDCPDLATFKAEDKVFVVINPDANTTKVDVAFFAQKANQQNREIVRVLAQLTVQKDFPKSKVTDSFDAMLGLRALENISDVRLFIGPRDNAKWNAQAFYTGNYVENRCYLFQKDSGIEEQFQLPLDVMCYSEGFERDKALNCLTSLAMRLGDWHLAHNLDKQRISKRQRIHGSVLPASAPRALMASSATSGMCNGQEIDPEVTGQRSSEQSIRNTATALRAWLLRFVPQRFPKRRAKITDEFCQELADCSIDTGILEMMLEDPDLLAETYIPRLKGTSFTVLKMLLKAEAAALTSPENGSGQPQAGPV